MTYQKHNTQEPDESQVSFEVMLRTHLQQATKDRNHIRAFSKNAFLLSLVLKAPKIV